MRWRWLCSKAPLVRSASMMAVPGEQLTASTVTAVLPSASRRTVMLLALGRGAGRRAALERFVGDAAALEGQL